MIQGQPVFIKGNKIMNSPLTVTFVVMISLALATLTGCPKKTLPILVKSPTPVFLTNPPDFESGPEGGADWIYVKEGADIRSYNKLMMEYVEFYIKEDAGYKGIDPMELEILAREFHEAMIAALGETYPLVDKPGPDVMRFRVAITNMTPSRPDISKTVDVLRSGYSNMIKRGSIGRQHYVGEASIEVELLDSLTNERLAAAMDTKVVEKYEFHIGKWDQVEEGFKFWAKRLRRFLDSVHSK